MATRLPKAIVRSTKAFADLRDRYKELFTFVATIAEQAARLDENRLIALRALAKTGDKSDREKLARAEAEPSGPARRSLTATLDLQRKIVFIQGVDYFLVYLADLLKTIHKSNPDMLKSDEKLSYSEAYQFSKMSDLIDYMIERRVIDLTFKSIKQLSYEVQKKHGFQLFRSEVSIRLISSHVEKRNLLVHNAGRVNRRYIDRTGSRAKDGDLIPMDRLFDGLIHLELAARDLDGRAQQKFKIRRSDLTDYSEEW